MRVGWKHQWKALAAVLALAQPALATAQAPVAQAPAAQAPAAPRPAIWLLEDEDTKIYLFGTIHILPPGFKWRSAALDRVVDGADELVVETYDKPGEGMWDEAAMLFFTQEPSPILERVPAEKRDALRAAIAAGPVPIEGYDMMHTWAAAVTLGLASLLGEYGVEDAKDAPGVEDVLEEVFRKAGKPTGSFEDPIAVLSAMNALTPAVQSQLLVETENGQKHSTRWTRWPPDRGGWSEADDLPPAIYDVLIRKRNAAWTRAWRALGGRQRAVRGRRGHLAGPDSVQKMLARGAARAPDRLRVPPSIAHEQCIT
jgi:uncharacterized protein YbaP (TraB family)